MHGKFNGTIKSDLYMTLKGQIQGHSDFKVLYLGWNYFHSLEMSVRKIF